MKNGAKMRATVSGRMSEPLSETSGPTSLPVGARGGGRCGRSRRGRAGRRETVISPDFLPMASEALLTRLMTICRSCGVGELGGGTSERWRLRRVFLWIETQRRVTVQRMRVGRLTAGRRGRACRRRRASGGRDRRCGGRRPRCGRGGDWRGAGAEDAVAVADAGEVFVVAGAVGHAGQGVQEAGAVEDDARPKRASSWRPITSRVSAGRGMARRTNWAPRRSRLRVRLSRKARTLRPTRRATTSPVAVRREKRGDLRGATSTGATGQPWGVVGRGPRFPRWAGRDGRGHAAQVPGMIGARGESLGRKKAVRERTAGRRAGSALSGRRAGGGARRGRRRGL